MREIYVFNVITTTNSIKLIRQCLILTVFYTFIINFSFEIVIAEQVRPTHNKKTSDVLNDLPLQMDLNKYLTVLEKIVNFVSEHKIYVDSTFAFSMFLINVNLKSIVDFKEAKIENYYKTRLQQLLKKNDEIMMYFRGKVRLYLQETNPKTAICRIPELFSNEETWRKHLQKFQISLLQKTRFYSIAELSRMYPRWNRYSKLVLSSIPLSHNLYTSDNCVSHLVRNPVNNGNKWLYCKKDDVSCYNLILNGTNFGYGITNRLLYFIMARFSRGCAVVSPSKDKEIVDNLCVKMYNEVEYLALNSFQLPHLAMQQMGLCSLEGHVQFLRRSWIDDLQKLQNAFGCFGKMRKRKLVARVPEDSSSEHSEWQLIHKNGGIMGGLCNSHSTGVAAAMFAAAIRYILEKFY